MTPLSTNSRERLFTMALTPSQEAALEAVRQFKNSPDISMTIAGEAGTGKTFLANIIIHEIFRKISVTVTAPTHRAVSVISNKTGIRGSTIHSLLGLRPNMMLDTFDIKNVQFTNDNNEEKIKNYKYIIIDESSMLGHDISKFILIKAKQHNTKIIFIGDTAQLPPVNEIISDIFKNPRLVVLKEVVRQQNDNPLLDLLAIMRRDIHSVNGHEFIDYINKYPTNIIKKEDGSIEGYIALNLQDFCKALITYTNKPEMNDCNPVLDFCKYAAYSNESVQIYNKFIRENREVSAGVSDLFIAGDILTGYSNVLTPDLEPLITNSIDYVVEDVVRRPSNDGFYVYQLSIRSKLTSKPSDIMVVDHFGPNYEIYVNTLKLLRNDALAAQPTQRASKWKAYYRYKDTYLSAIPVNLGEDNNKKDEDTKNLDYGYAFTTHKLQGSTVAHMFVNALDMIYYNGDPTKPRVNTPNMPDIINIRNRLMYTALSRTSKVAFILWAL